MVVKGILAERKYAWDLLFDIALHMQVCGVISLLKFVMFVFLIFRKSWISYQATNRSRSKGFWCTHDNQLYIITAVLSSPSAYHPQHKQLIFTNNITPSGPPLGGAKLEVWRLRTVPGHNHGYMALLLGLLVTWHWLARRGCHDKLFCGVVKLSLL